MIFNVLGRTGQNVLNPKKTEKPTTKSIPHREAQFLTEYSNVEKYKKKQKFFGLFRGKEINQSLGIVNTPNKKKSVFRSTVGGQLIARP